ncbi:MAG: hypothetical protein ACREA0_32645, partial [bacterium]
GQHDPNQSMPPPEIRTLVPPLQRVKLLPKRRCFECDCSLFTTDQSDGSEERGKGRQHAVSCRGLDP